MSRRASVPALEPVAMSTQLVEEIVGGLELVPEGRLDEHHARALDERIRLTAGTVRDRLTRLSTLVEQAKAGEVWDVLGFASWTAYLADALGGQLHLPSGERRELVALLAGEGMSTRAMAPIVGASPRTVARDVETLDLPGVPGDTAAVRSTLDGSYVPKVGDLVWQQMYSPQQPANDSTIAERVAGGALYGGRKQMRVAGIHHQSDGRTRWALKSPTTKGQSLVEDDWCVLELVEAASVVVTGLDGKTYTKPKPKPVQPTIEGTEPERMVPTLPGLGISQQPVRVLQDWYGAFCDWWKHPGPMGTKRVEVAEDAYRAGWLAHEASISSHV